MPKRKISHLVICQAEDGLLCDVAKGEKSSSKVLKKSVKIPPLRLLPHPIESLHTYSDFHPKLLSRDDSVSFIKRGKFVFSLRKDATQHSPPTLLLESCTTHNTTSSSSGEQQRAVGRGVSATVLVKKKIVIIEKSSPTLP